MKALVAIIILIAVSGCIDGRPVLEGHSVELSHKCQMDPYKPDCLQPPPVFHN
jgi:hypothetical protein